ncbi:MAG TPA: ATP-binding cassette domain-containing protein, partial [Deferrisomatales bacterium]|nr:ATP-binding cassette domain-containing protein [Deferrisomatales bacterium]
MAESVLELQHISLSFGGVNALTDVSFAVEAGSVTAVVGPNGAGKTSLFN